MHIINRVFWPAEDATAQLAHDLARGLARRGWQVGVITASPGPAVLPDAPEENAALVTIHRTGADARRRTGLLAKAGGYGRFAWEARRTIATQVRAGDRVIVMTDPPLLSVWLRSALARTGAQVYHWAQDIYPEVAVAIAPLGRLSPLLNLLRPARDGAWREAHRIVTLGEDMAELIAARGIPRDHVAVIPNWPPQGLAPLEPAATRAQWGARPRDLVIGYSGNLGRAHDLQPLLTLAERLRDDDDIRFVVVGHGPQQAMLQAESARRGLTNLQFFPPVPREQLGASLAAADLHLVTMREACRGMVWPSKFYGIVACGRPVLFFGPQTAGIARLTREHGLGLAVPTVGVEAAEQWVRQLAASPALRAELRSRVQRFATSETGVERSIAAWHTILAGASSTSSELS